MTKTKRRAASPRTIPIVAGPRRRSFDVVFVYSDAPGGLTPDEAVRLALALRACSDDAG